jgi:hypothetical protein
MGLGRTAGDGIGDFGQEGEEALPVVVVGEADG